MYWNFWLSTLSYFTRSVLTTSVFNDVVRCLTQDLFWRRCSAGRSFQGLVPSNLFCDVEESFMLLIIVQFFEILRCLYWSSREWVSGKTVMWGIGFLLGSLVTTLLKQWRETKSEPCLSNLQEGVFVGVVFNELLVEVQRGTGSPWLRYSVDRSPSKIIAPIHVYFGLGNESQQLGYYFLRSQSFNVK